tara:strand:+ start:97 stop:717 length:621 start_codon:yes stop_codon:yes gene_type:complete
MAFLWSLHADKPRVLYNSVVHQWQQPSVISDRFPEYISTNYWHFDYEATEQELIKIKHSNSGELILNASTAKVLEKAISTLPTQMKKDELQCLELLITKGLPGRAGRQLASIFTDFYYYQQALNGTNSTASKQPDINDQEQSFKHRVWLQEKYLTKDISERFFGRQNRLNSYLYARKSINEDASLNSAQKQQKLNTLQDRFKANEE